MNETIITLKYPTKKGQTTLKLRRPKDHDRIVAANHKGTQAEIEVHLFSNLCGISPEEITNLDMKDYLQLQLAYKAFYWH
jgi:hypothetical protein